MNTSTYLIKAIENYSFDLEQCYESLNYALSYEEDNPIALCLMGRLQDEYFGNPTLAILLWQSNILIELWDLICRM